MSSNPAYSSRGTPPRSTSLRAEARRNSRQHPWNRKRNDRLSKLSFSSPSWDSSNSGSGTRSATDNSIFKGAEILREQIRRQQQEAENDIVLRGAASVKAQLRAQSPAASRASSDDWSDPWEAKPTSDETHPVVSETSSNASASRLSTPQSDFSSDGFGTPTRSEESSRMFPEESYEKSYESFDEVKRNLDMNTSEVRMRRFEDSLDYEDDDDDDSSSFRPRGDASEWRRRASNESIPKPRYQGDEAVVYSQDEDDSSHDDEKDDLRQHYHEASIHSSGELDDMGFPIVRDGEVPEWTDSSATASTEPPPPPSRDPPTPPPPPAGSPDTPVTHMGRGNSLKLKIHTYNVQRVEDFTDSDTYSNETYSTIESPSTGTKSSGSYDDLVYSMSQEYTPSSRETFPGNGNKSVYSDPDPSLSASSASYLPNKFFGQSNRFDDSDEEEGSSSSFLPRQLQPERTSPALSPRILSPMTATYSKLARDPAYRHAQRAGLLWQTLVSKHVRFPGHWWDGARSPQMGMMEDYSGNGKAHCDWKYLARHRVYSNPQLKRFVRNRASAGRLLLHIVVRDLMTYLPVQDIAIGCFHPNARGVRKTENPDRNEEDCREVWMAVRKRCEDGSVSAVDRYLTRGRGIEEVAQASPLSGKPRVSNQNMRAVSN